MKTQIGKNTKNLYAVCIGINKYADEDIGNLKFARTDAEKICNLLQQNFPKSSDNIHLLLDEDATGIEIRELLEGYLKNNSTEEDVVIIFYSGHGTTELTGSDKIARYLVPHDAVYDKIVGSCISLGNFDRILEKIIAKQIIVFMDCCFSGRAGGKTFKKAGTKSVAIRDTNLIEEISGEGRVIVCASKDTEVAFEHEKIKHGIFTYAVLQGLCGNNMAQRNKKLKLTDLLSFIEDQVPKKCRELGTKKIQTPNYEGYVESIILPVLKGDFSVLKNSFSTELEQMIKKQIMNIAIEFSKTKDDYSINYEHLTIKKLTNLASPIKKAAPTLETLDIIDELSKRETKDVHLKNANMYAIAIILRERKDPRYINLLINQVSEQSYSAVVVWRMLRAIADTTQNCKFTEQQICYLETRLKLVVDNWRSYCVGLAQRKIIRKTFDSWGNLGQVVKIAKKTKISLVNIFSVNDIEILLAERSKKSKSKVMQSVKLTSCFFEGKPRDVAKKLLVTENGKARKIIFRENNVIYEGIISAVEAYGNDKKNSDDYDPAAYSGPKSKSQLVDPGCLVFVPIRGYYSLNISTSQKESQEVVYIKNLKELNHKKGGPKKVAEHLGIDKNLANKYQGISLDDPNCQISIIETNIKVKEVVTKKRIGPKDDYEWRYEAVFAD